MRDGAAPFFSCRSGGSASRATMTRSPGSSQNSALAAGISAPSAIVGWNEDAVAQPFGEAR